jgi:hypothetical protein
MSKTLTFQIKKTIFAMFVLGLFFLPHTGQAAFLRDLKLGDSGEDVRELQKLLNLDSRTRVSLTGSGALGQETAYFGALTRSAVTRFQELYATEVLRPIALVRGTGYVGPLTRQKLATFSPTLSNTGTLETSSNNVTPTPKIFSVSPQSGSDGTRVTIYGEGFLSTGNKVYASFDELENVSSVDGKQISFTVRDPFPNDLKFPPNILGNIPDFKYGFVVENRNGRSNVIEFTLINSKVKNQ